MGGAENAQQHGQTQPPGPAGMGPAPHQRQNTVHPHGQQAGEAESGDEAVPAPEQGVGDVTAVQLSDRKQVARGDECYFALLLAGMLYLRNRYEVEGG